MPKRDRGEHSSEEQSEARVLSARASAAERRARQFEVAEPTAKSTPSAPLSRARVTLRWTQNEERCEATLDEDATLGSAQGVTVRVVDPSVSRLHARIEWRPDGAWITDLESTNGTSVERIRVSSARLYDGAKIGLGNISIHVSVPGTRTDVAQWPGDRFGPLVGRSSAMRALFQQLSRVAQSQSTVLVTGETGTGKDLVALAIHEHSPRREGPLVVVDCAAIPEPLFEAELFGHARGAFTGADRDRPGAFEAASGGTLFLDEVGELPPSLQPKLLRALESRSVRRVGEHGYREVDVRVIAATHRDLARMVSTGAFREDLFFRLAVIPVHVPPLRERREDIEPLVQHFLSGRALDGALGAEVSSRAWLGNVRELRNFVERAAALGASGALDAMPAIAREQSGLPEVDLDEPFKDAKERWTAHLERRYLEALLERKRWNVSAVAQAMGLDRTYVHRLMRKHGLDR